MVPTVAIRSRYPPSHAHLSTAWVSPLPLRSRLGGPVPYPDACCWESWEGLAPYPASPQAPRHSLVQGAVTALLLAPRGFPQRAAPLRLLWAAAPRAPGRQRPARLAPLRPPAPAPNARGCPATAPRAQRARGRPQPLAEGEGPARKGHRWHKTGRRGRDLRGVCGL